MKDNMNMPKWQKLLIAFFSIVITICLILCVTLKDIINYDYDNDISLSNLYGVYGWDDGLGYTHIGNISRLDIRGHKLDDNWVNIGNNYWYSHNIEDVDYNEDLGNLIGLYTYSIEDSSNYNYGESASLWIYDISNKLLSQNISKDDFYKSIYNEYLKDTASIWKISSDFTPFLALGTGPRTSHSINKKNRNIQINSSYKEYFIIFANERIYQFNFSNKKYEDNGIDGYKIFHKRCKSIVKDTDLLTYTKWKHDKEIKEQEQNDRDNWWRILFVVIFIVGSIIFMLRVKKTENFNSQARKLARYIISCYILNLLLVCFWVMSKIYSDSYIVILVLFIPSIFILSSMEVFLANRSSKNNYNYYLIPDILIKRSIINTEFQKRVLMVFLIYPLFFIAPLPIIGSCFILLYILPVLLIFGIINTFLWLRKGWIQDFNTKNQKEKARLYCRHCGKLIDADSCFCRYCGNKL